MAAASTVPELLADLSALDALQFGDPSTRPSTRLISRWRTPLVCVTWPRLLAIPEGYREVLPITCRTIDGQVSRGTGVSIGEPPAPRDSGSLVDEPAAEAAARRQREAYEAELRRIRQPRRSRTPRDPRNPRRARTPRANRFPRAPRRPRRPRTPRPPREPRPPRIPHTRGESSDIYCVYSIGPTGAIRHEPTVAYPRGTIPPPFIGQNAFRVPMQAGGCLGFQCTGPMTQHLERMLSQLPREWRVANDQLVEQAREREVTHALLRQRHRIRREPAPTPAPTITDASRPFGWEAATVFQPMDAVSREVSGNQLIGLLSGGSDPNAEGLAGVWNQLSGTFVVHVRRFF